MLPYSREHRTAPVMDLLWDHHYFCSAYSIKVSTGRCLPCNIFWRCVDKAHICLVHYLSFFIQVIIGTKGIYYWNRTAMPEKLCKWSVSSFSSQICFVLCSMLNRDKYLEHMEKLKVIKIKLFWNLILPFNSVVSMVTPASHGTCVCDAKAFLKVTQILTGGGNFWVSFISMKWVFYFHYKQNFS